MKEAKTFRVVVGEAVRNLRESSQKRQEDVSQTARALGLAWSRSKVATLEQGGKAVTLEEFVILPTVLTEALGRPVTYEDLFPDPDELLYLTPKLRVLAGRLTGIFDAGGYVPEWTHYDRAVEDALDRLEETMDALKPMLARMKALGFPTGLQALANIREHPVGIAEGRAAKKLDEPRLVVMAVGLDLWGRPLTAERDARVAELLPDSTDAASVQAKRGRITRELVEEMKAAISRREKG